MLSLHTESLAPVPPLLFLILLSSLTSAFKVQFPIASGSNMSVSYVVDIATLILRGPHATMIVGAASGWSQTVLRTRVRNPAYRTLFNMACLVNTIPIAFAIALTTEQSAWIVWKSEFASTAPNYLLGAIAAAVVLAVMES